MYSSCRLFFAFVLAHLFWNQVAARYNQHFPEKSIIRLWGKDACFGPTLEPFNQTEEGHYINYVALYPCTEVKNSWSIQIAKNTDPKDKNVVIRNNRSGDCLMVSDGDQAGPVKEGIGMIQHRCEDADWPYAKEMQFSLNYENGRGWEIQNAWFGMYIVRTKAKFPEKLEPRAEGIKLSKNKVWSLKLDRIPTYWNITARADLY